MTCAVTEAVAIACGEDDGVVHEWRGFGAAAGELMGHEPSGCNGNADAGTWT